MQMALQNTDQIQLERCNSTPPGTFGHFNLTLGLRQGQLQALYIKGDAVSRLGPFEPPAFIQASGIDGVVAQIVEQLAHR
ncbi:hypothetical protein D3C84_909480 [compost metagenome]